ncbi:antitoxin VapB family protein [Haloarcula mannanilytica]|nr:antitoxin VapB family protein [Haloarcula mannanilytica]
MATADEQIRVSDRVKRQLDRRRREGESFNDVLERVLDESDETDFYDGFGILSDDDANWIRDKGEKSKEKRKERMQRLDENT